MIYDPDTYVRGVPYETLRRLREGGPVTWIEERPVTGGPGFWAVLGHAGVRAVLRAPETYSSQLGATQIRDPATPEDLAYRLLGDGANVKLVLKDGEIVKDVR